jgi:hypothetical protein
VQKNLRGDHLHHHGPRDGHHAEQEGGKDDAPRLWPLAVFAQPECQPHEGRQEAANDGGSERRRERIGARGVGNGCYQ